MKLTIETAAATIEIHVEPGAPAPAIDWITRQQLERATRKARHIGRRLVSINEALAAIAGPAAAKSRVTANLTDRREPMAKFQDLSAALDAVDTVTNELAANVHIVVDNEAAQISEIQALKDQLAGGVPVTQEQLDALVSTAQSRVAALESVRDTLRAIATDPNNPIPEVPPIEVEPGTGGGETEPGTGGGETEPGGGSGEPEPGASATQARRR